jgi:transposase
MPTNFLNLPLWEVGTVKQSKDDYRVEATYTVVPERCPNCPESLFAGKVYKHGTMKQEVMDLPSHSKRVGILLTRVRLRCQECEKTFLQPIPDLDERGTMTARLVRYIEAQSLRKTFVAVADEVGVTEGTVRNVFGRHVKHLEETTFHQTPERLGIDELYLLKKARAVFTNLRERTIIGVLKDRLKKSVGTHLRTLDVDTVKVVAIDMHKAYKDAVREAIPNATIVVDKFHVVRMANTCLEGVRKSFRAGLESKERRKLMHDRFVLLRRNRDLDDEQKATLAGWQLMFPKLGAAYTVKEAFFDLWDAPDRTTAADRFKAWEYGITDHDMLKAYQPLLTAWRNWEQEILAYFEHRETNAVTEALNGIVRHIERAGRGYSFDVMRAKMLFGTKSQKRPPYNGDECGSSGGGDQNAPEELGDTYGADVDSLLAELEAENPIPTPDTEQEEGDE